MKEAQGPVILSIIIPTFNSERTLEQCLQAVRSSFYQDRELIVVDDGSKDKTVSIAEKYAGLVVSQGKHQGRSYARKSGIEKAKGEILVFIDSDVVIKQDTLTTIADYFSVHPEVDALTGLLSKEHPNADYFSQYKNLYMNYTFSRLLERVNFLYGSLFAVRRRALIPYGHEVKIADDTEFGQRLTAEGKRIDFLKGLEVLHLKKYNFFSLVKNDFLIPFDWASIFIRHKGWRELGKNQTGYLHSPKEQLVSVILAPLIFFSAFLSLRPLVVLTLTWFFLNLRFFRFLTREKGFIFGLASVGFTLFDHLVMALGILAGFAKAVLTPLKK